MQHPIKSAALASVSLLAFAAAAPGVAVAQTASPGPSASIGQTPAGNTAQTPVANTINAASASGPQLEEIVVTAQKRSQSINSVPLTITAVSGQKLRDAGITDTRDLVKLVPSFNYSQTIYGSPVYSIRGVGLQDVNIAAVPTVSIYLDETPIPYSSLSRVADFDLERVEVLKGPQGTLFGQNSTGGAVGYIAAKPTNHLAAGLDLTYGRFGAGDYQGFISGPVTDTLSVRLAFSAQEGGAWQYSYTRPDDHRGTQRREYARLLVDWHPTDRLKVELNASGGIDKSDSQNAQIIAVLPRIPGTLPPGLVNYPLPPSNPRAADWDAGVPFRRNDSQYYATATINYDLSSGVLFKAIGGYQKYNSDDQIDTDGTSYQNLTSLNVAHIKDTYGEVRLQSQGGGNLKWVLGANIDHNIVQDDTYGSEADSFTEFTIPGHGFANDDARSHQISNAYAGYADATWTPIAHLDLDAGVRYTQLNKSFAGCTADAGDGQFASVGEFLTLVQTGQSVSIPNGACVSEDAAGFPALAHLKLDQHNVSWKVGPTWRFGSNKLVYASVSRGYKGGSFPELGATKNEQYEPATQEAVTAYEIGTKLSLFDRRVQLNGAIFYYNYKDKQILGRVIVPIFGELTELVNIPKSSIKGAEIEATYTPLKGLTFHAAGTFVDSKIKGPYDAYSQLGVLSDVGGETFPNTPKWYAVADANYKWSLNERLSAFVGASALYQSRANGSLGDPSLFNIPAYATLDLQAGVATDNGRYRLTVWGRNVTNKLYFNSVNYYIETVTRYTGMPATYGATLSFRY